MTPNADYAGRSRSRQVWDALETVQVDLAGLIDAIDAARVHAEDVRVDMLVERAHSKALVIARELLDLLVWLKEEP